MRLSSNADASVAGLAYGLVAEAKRHRITIEPRAASVGWFRDALADNHPADSILILILLAPSERLDVGRTASLTALQSDQFLQSIYATHRLPSAERRSPWWLVAQTGAVWVPSQVPWLPSMATRIATSFTFCPQHAARADDDGAV